MRASRFAAGIVVLALLALARGGVLPGAAADGTSIVNAGQGGWTTPPSGSLQDAPVPVTTTWSAPAAPPMPAPGPVVQATPYAQTPYAAAPAAPQAPTTSRYAPPGERCYSGCGLPCADGISQWHVRGVLGYAFAFGDDPPNECLYWGLDLGRTFCGCWGLDLFYRYHSGQFDRANLPQPTKDGGEWHHVGAKFTYEFGFGGRWYGWAGIGPEYWWTNDFLNDDSGFGVFGELGVGYVINQSWRVRAGVNVHGLDTDVTRENPANDGQSRWLWFVAPVIEVEFSF
jgi:hypothetical protein